MINWHYFDRLTCPSQEHNYNDKRHRSVHPVFSPAFFGSAVDSTQSARARVYGFELCARQSLARGSTELMTTIISVRSWCRQSRECTPKIDAVLLCVLMTTAPLKIGDTKPQGRYSHREDRIKPCCYQPLRSRSVQTKVLRTNKNEPMTMLPYPRDFFFNIMTCVQYALPRAVPCGGSETVSFHRRRFCQNVGLGLGQPHLMPPADQSQSRIPRFIACPPCLGRDIIATPHLALALVWSYRERGALPVLGFCRSSALEPRHARPHAFVV